MGSASGASCAHSGRSGVYVGAFHALARDGDFGARRPDGRIRRAGPYRRATHGDCVRPSQNYRNRFVERVGSGLQNWVCDCRFDRAKASAHHRDRSVLASVFGCVSCWESPPFCRRRAPSQNVAAVAAATGERRRAARALSAAIASAATRWRAA